MTPLINVVLGKDQIYTAFNCCPLNISFNSSSVLLVAMSHPKK